MGKGTEEGFCFSPFTLPWQLWPHLSSWHSALPPDGVGRCHSQRVSDPAWRFFPNPESRERAP